MKGNGPDGGGRERQLHIFDGEAREHPLGTLEAGEEAWDLVLVAETAGPDLCRGRLSFRREGRRYDTGPVIVEESEQAVLRRAGELPASTLRQFLHALRD